MSDDDGTPGINEDLIRKYHAEGDLPGLLTVFNFLRRQTTRAEMLSRAYLAQVTILQARLSETRTFGEGKGRMTSDTKPPEHIPRSYAERKVTTTTKPPSKPKTAAIDIEL